MTCLLVSTKLILILSLSVVSFFAAVASRIPLPVVARNLKWFLWLFLITFGIHALNLQLSESFPYLGLAVSREGVSLGLVYTARLALLVVFAALLTLTTAPVELTDSVEKLLAPLKRFKIQVHEFALMMTLALRFIPILIHEGERIKNAQLSRGASMEGSLFVRLKSVVPMVMPLFLSSIRRADELADAMAARSYSGGQGRTSYRRFLFGRDDYLVLLLSTLFLIGAFTLRL